MVRALAGDSTMTSEVDTVLLVQHRGRDVNHDIVGNPGDRTATTAERHVVRQLPVRSSSIDRAGPGRQTSNHDHGRASNQRTDHRPGYLAGFG